MDDKVGVYIALQALKDRNNIKAVFFRDEEIGKIGSNFSIKNNKNFYEDCKYVIQNDRKGADNFIYNSGGINICSEKFREDCADILIEHGYKEEKGLTSDIDTLVKGGIGISAVNLSCGYFRPHSDKEIVSISLVKNTYRLTNKIFDRLTDKYEHKYIPFTYKNNKNKNNNSQKSFNFYSEDKNVDIYMPSHNSEFKEDMLKIDLSKEGEFKLFSKLQNKDFYTLKNRSNIEVPIKKYKCSCCKEENTTYFIPNENRFFCISCNDYIYGEAVIELRKMLIIKDSKHKFYHNGIVNRWIKDNAIWDDKFRIYRHKTKKDT